MKSTIDIGSAEYTIQCESNRSVLRYALQQTVVYETTHHTHAVNIFLMGFCLPSVIANIANHLLKDIVTGPWICGTESLDQMNLHLTSHHL